MTTTTQHKRNTRVPFDSDRKTALVAGGLYLLSFASIPTLALYGPINEPRYILGSGPDSAVQLGGLLEIIVALACIGTAVTLFPVLKRLNEGAAMAFVGARILEAGTIFAGVACLLAVVSLRQSGVGTDGLIDARVLVLLHQWFQLGQSLMPAVNAALLGTLLYRSRLVPRWIPMLGLIGSPLLAASTVAIMFGIEGPVSTLAALGALPIAVWEFSLGVYLVARGFRPAALAAIK